MQLGSPQAQEKLASLPLWRDWFTLGAHLFLRQSIPCSLRDIQTKSNKNMGHMAMTFSKFFVLAKFLYFSVPGKRIALLLKQIK
jgi:hypothetical protein